MAKLHALLVGINEYAHIGNLTACEGDIDRIDDLLHNYWRDTLAFEPKILKSAAATRDSIIGSFREIFEDPNIEKGDIGLFYFSGHGGQEVAAEYFAKDSHTNLLENLACHDSDLNTGANFIADKELRYLIHHATKKGLKLVTIFDCCHAGGNTRGIEDDEQPKYRKRLAPKVGQRSWDQFIFAGDDLTEEMLKDNSIEDIIPEGKHIQIAACEAKQSAIELENQGGVFTSGLVDLIKDFGGKINYYELNNQLQAYVRKRVNNQDPQLYIFPGSANERDRVSHLKTQFFTDFLSDSLSNRPLTTEIYFNSSKRKWILNAGGVYGVTQHWRGQPQRIPVYDRDELLGYMKIASIQAGFSILDNDDDVDLISRENYTSQIPSLLGTNLKVSISSLSQPQQDLLSAQFETMEGLSIIADESEADVCVRSNDIGMFLTNPNEDNPLSALQTGADQIAQISTQLEAVKKWQFTKDIQNADQTLPDDCLRIEYHNGDEVKPLTNDFRFPAGEPFSLEVHNTTDQELHLSVIYLSSLFEIMPLAQQKVIELENTKPWTQKFRSVEPEPFIEEFNWPSETIHLLFIASTESFNIELLIQEGLKPPSRDDFATNTRGLSFEPEAQKHNGWMAKCISCQIPNTKYVDS